MVMFATYAKEEVNGTEVSRLRCQLAYALDTCAPRNTVLSRILTVTLKQILWTKQTITFTNRYAVSTV